MPLFERVESGLDFVAVSYLAMAETIYVLRKLTTNQFRPTSADDHAGIRSACRLIEARFVKHVGELVNDEHADIVEPSNVLFDHQRRVLSKMHDYSGRITGGTRAKYQYAGLGPADVEHAYLASYAGVSTFYTADKAFDSLNGDPTFAGISFKILEKTR